MSSIKVPKGGVCITSPDIRGVEAKNIGSALAVCVSDAAAGVSGMALPLLPVKTEAGQMELPLDAASCLKLLFKDLINAGCSRENFRIWLVGAGRFMEEPKELALGVHIYATVKKILQKNSMNIHGEHVGGSFDRSAVLESGAETLSVILSDGREVSI